MLDDTADNGIVRQLSLYTSCNGSMKSSHFGLNYMCPLTT